MASPGGRGKYLVECLELSGFYVEEQTWWTSQTVEQAVGAADERVGASSDV